MIVTIKSLIFKPLFLYFMPFFIYILSNIIKKIIAKPEEKKAK